MNCTWRRGSSACSTRTAALTGAGGRADSRPELARSRLEESLRIYRRLGNERGVAAVRQSLGRVYPELCGDGGASFSGSEPRNRKAAGEPFRRRPLFNLGYARLLVGNPPSARAHFEEGLKIFRKLGVGSSTAATRVATRRGLL